MPHLRLIAGGRTPDVELDIAQRTTIAFELLELLKETDPSTLDVRTHAQLRDSCHELSDALIATIAGRAIDAELCWCVRCGVVAQAREADACTDCLEELG